MRGFIGLILLLFAFAMGIMVERLWLAAPPTVIENQGIATTHPQMPKERRYMPIPSPSDKPGPQIESANSTIEQLQAQNRQLQQQLLVAQQQTSAPAIQLANGDLSAVLSQQYQQEARDGLWADELELLINDFLYQSDLSHLVSLYSYGCKTTVCQVELVPSVPVDEFDEANWRAVSKKLFEQSWFKRFTMSTSSSTSERMQIYLSTQQVVDQ
ncbi:hypothetical protein [Pseudoalteromonas sp. JW3]|nr:hypothetical protein [Pseudoalteromonas sp. JW3]